MIRYLKFLGAFALAASFIAAPSASYAGVFIGINVNFGPPALPVYVQPPCPQPDLVWEPGYWGYGPYGYYWVPGTWVPAPEVGDLWTPGYWAYDDSAYDWHPGYWGREVGYYGGIDYGSGYFGNGFYGGGWHGRHFRYNTAYWNVDRNRIRNVYVNRTTVVNNNFGRFGRASYNGGPHGVYAHATPSQIAYARERHTGPTSIQREHGTIAAKNRNYLATVNRGRPANVAIARPLTAHGRPSNFAPISKTTATMPVRTVHGKRTAFYRAPGSARSGSTFENAGMAHNAAMHDTAAHNAAVKYHTAAVHPAYKTQTTYHAPAAYHAAVHTYHAPAYHPATTYHAPAYHPATTYHAPAYRPATTYHSTYHAAPAYHVSRPATTYHASHAGGAPSHMGGGAPRGGGAQHGGGGHEDHHK